MAKTEVQRIYEEQKRREEARKEAVKLALIRQHQDAKRRREAEQDARRGPR